MKVLFLISSSMEEPSPSWHLMKALLEDTLDSGINVHAIQEHYSSSVYDRFPKSISNNDKFSYNEVVSKKVDRKNLPKRYLNGISYAIKARKYIKKCEDKDVIFVQSTATALYSLIAARLCANKSKIIYNSQDMFPGSAIANGSMPNKFMQKIFYALQKIAYKKADIITAISEDMKIKLIEQGVPADKIKVIINWYDDNAVREIEWKNNRFVKNYNLSEDKFYVQYAGTMGTNFNPEIILDVAELLKNETNIEFQMIGNGVRKEKFMEDAKSRELDNIVFYPLQKQDMVSDVYSACSVCLIPLQQGVIGNSVPSKAALLMACGRVIVNSVDEESDYAEMFNREKIGFSYGTKDAKGLAEKILELSKNPKLLEEYGKRAKIYGDEFYSRKNNTKKYVELFNDLVNWE